MADLPSLDEIRQITRNSFSDASGCFGEVFRIRNYAIKRIALREQNQKAIDREQSILDWISKDATRSPFLVEYHCCYIDAGWAYLVFTWMEAKLEVRGGGKPFAVAQRVLKQLAESIRYLHSKNLVHRDIKPDNILLTTSDLSTAFVRLADFGFCKILRPEDISHTTGIGTPYYAAPEILHNLRTYGCKVDVWSFGVVAYELLTGVKPYPASTMQQLKALQSQGVPRGQGFPEGYEHICQGFIDFCLVYDPKMRPNIDDVLRHPFFDQTPRLWSAINIVMEADNLLEKMQRFLHYLKEAGMEENYQSFECASTSMLLPLKEACESVKITLEEGHQDIEQVAAVLERINMVQSTQ
jgi:serine/threonine protein kinase